MEECHFQKIVHSQILNSTGWRSVISKNIVHSGIILQYGEVSFHKNSTFWNNTTGWRSVISKNIVHSGIILQDGGVSFPKI